MTTMKLTTIRKIHSVEFGELYTSCGRHVRKIFKDDHTSITCVSCWRWRCGGHDSYPPNHQE